jgi:hypothetical protein
MGVFVVECRYIMTSTPRCGSSPLSGPSAKKDPVAGFFYALNTDPENRVKVSYHIFNDTLQVSYCQACCIVFSWKSMNSLA